MINGTAKVMFGAGDILVTPSVRVDNGEILGTLVFQEMKDKHYAGDYCLEPFKETYRDTTLVFSGVESLDVVIERLQRLKQLMMKE